MRKRILFVEDDDTFGAVLEREMSGFGHEVTRFATGEDALRFVRENRVDVALLDLKLPGMSGQELLERIREIAPGLPVVFLTGHGALQDAVTAMRAGAYDFLKKPVSLDDLELTLKRAVEHGNLVRQNRLLRSLVDREFASEIVGECAAINALRASIPRIAASDANVLVFGENGTGKELVARAIHDASPRRRGAFVVVNCGAIPTELFESELFGHRRGAFTGADRKRLGLVELAEGGTLFLDEVGELPLEVQPALLRFLQFGEFRAVGAERNEVADVRVVSATNRDLAKAVEQGEFREDLYHRLSTLGLAVPPLRERGRDLLGLAQLFLQRFNDRLPPDAALRFSAGALERLTKHPWAGNVRELENVIVRLVTLADGPVIDADDVERHLFPVGTRQTRETGALDLESVERAAVLRALRRHAGHRERAAAELGIATKTLYNKIQHHGISAGDWEAGEA